VDCQVAVTPAQAATLPNWQCFHEHCDKCHAANEKKIAKRKAKGYSCEECYDLVSLAVIATHPSDRPARHALCLDCCQAVDEPSGEPLCASDNCAVRVYSHGDMCAACVKELQSVVARLKAKPKTK
jgi:hypothetical protein